MSRGRRAGSRVNDVGGGVWVGCAKVEWGTCVEQRYCDFHVLLAASLPPLSRRPLTATAAAGTVILTTYLLLLVCYYYYLLTTDSLLLVLLLLLSLLLVLLRLLLPQLPWTDESIVALIASCTSAPIRPTATAAGTASQCH